MEDIKPTEEEQKYISHILRYGITTKRFGDSERGYEPPNHIVDLEHMFLKLYLQEKELKVVINVLKDTLENTQMLKEQIKNSIILEMRNEI
jgi:hypothetical protein